MRTGVRVYVCVCVADSGSTLYVADDRDLRILTVDTSDSTVASVSGSGVQGTEGGDAASTQWESPWGMALTSDGTRLFVAERTAPSVRSVAIVSPPSDVEWAVTSQVRSPRPGGTWLRVRQGDARGLSSDVGRRV